MVIQLKVFIALRLQKIRSKQNTFVLCLQCLPNSISNKIQQFLDESQW